MKALIPRATIEDIVLNRNRAIALYGEAYEMAAAAQDKLNEAFNAMQLASPGRNAFTYSQEDEVKAFHSMITVPRRDSYLRTARKLIDTNVWASIIERTDLERLMDKQAKDQLRAQMAFVPDRHAYDHKSGQMITSEEVDLGMPEVSVGNILATIEAFMMDADMIFQRGVANAFAKLDRRFRSHDGWKIGSRIILTRFFNDFGSWNYGSNERDTLMDIERTFTILDDSKPKELGEEGKAKVKPNYASTIGKIDEARKGASGPRQDLVETDYFRIRIFQNGNAHLWMLRDDLVRKVNKLLGEYYGDAIGDHENVPTDEDVLNNPKTAVAKNYAFFPTPAAAAAKVVEEAQLSRRKSETPITVLEPSAGSGNLARLAARMDFSSWSGGRTAGAAVYQERNIVDVVELHAGRAKALVDERLYRKTFHIDFLNLKPETTGLYDRIVMNPPFDRERDIDHVVHALKFLKPDGILVSIMSAGTEFRETKKSIAFRAMVEARGGWYRDLPAGSFAESGTYVNTLMCIIGRQKGW